MDGERNYYMVRAMASRDIDFDVFFGQGVIAVGWSTIDFSKCSGIDEIMDRIITTYHPEGISNNTLGKKKGNIQRFLEIKAGDYIIVPYYNAICIAEVQSSALSYCPNNADLANQKKVRYLKNTKGDLVTIPRHDLSNELQTRLRVPGVSVSDLTYFAQEITDIFEKKGGYAWNFVVQEKVERMEQELKKDLLERIRTGKSNLEAGGVGVERLVRELFECDGYAATIIAKNTYQGIADADVFAEKNDRFSSCCIYAQVKHHQGISDATGLEQLKGIHKATGHDLALKVFITTAEVTEEFRKEADVHDIKVMTGVDLVNWILEDFEKLSEETVRKLGLCRLPQIIH